MKKRKNPLPKIIFLTFLILLVIAMIYVVYINLSVNKQIDISLVRTGSSSVTRIYYYEKDDYGNIISEPIELKDEQLFLERNEWCSYYDMPENLINAFIAIEDRRFFEHNGVDWKRTAHATANYIINFGKSEFGGSTITQQLIKNLTGDNKQTPKRKIEEIIRAINLENNIGKFEILELYLNIVYLSQNCYGVKSAARVYFDKEIEQLSLAECATLASIVKSPVIYDPYKHPDKNRERRTSVLNAMHSMDMINDDEYNNAVNEEIIINEFIENDSKVGIYSWYTEALITDVINDLMAKYNLSYEGAQMMLYKGGLNIYTAVSPEIQKIAENVFKNYKGYIANQNGTYPQASCVIINPYNSDVLAIVGGVGVKKQNRILNRATDIKRPLGSTIKPLSVYAPAIEWGDINYSSVLVDVPIKIDENSAWPKNSPDVYHGLIDIEYAVSHSVNTVAVKILDTIGIDNSFNFLKNDLGYKLTKDDKNLSPLALGQLTNGESLLKLTNSYSMFQNGGYIGKPRTYYRVEDNYENVLLENKQTSKRVISEETASIMNKLLTKTVREGTAHNSNINGVINFAGKTGTSGNNYDKWFVGYSPYYVCGVWVGYDEPKSINTIGKSPAIQLFDAIMKEAHKDKDTKKELFLSPNIVVSEYCADSGMLPCENCKLDPRMNRIKIGYFKPGTEPKEVCNLHTEIYIDSYTGLVANEDTSYLLKRKVSLLNYERDRLYERLNISDNRYLISSRIPEE